jgi:hypothetical protein
VDLRFELGDPQAPRGHALVFARSSNAMGPVLATYCVVLPVAFSIGKYLPPMFAAQMPMEGLRDTHTLGVVPIPPMLEEVPNVETLRQSAERRGDDLCDIGTLLLTDDSQRVAYAAEAAAAYGQLFANYVANWPAVAVTPASPAERELEVEDVLAEVLSERDRLAELARSLGTLRYAMEGNDRRLREETVRSMRRIAMGLAQKYRTDQLIEAALRPDDQGAHLAQLYLQRAYKLVDEDYAAIPPIEREIRELQGETP